MSRGRPGTRQQRETPLDIMQIMVDGWREELRRNAGCHQMVFDDEAIGYRHIAIHRCYPNPDAKSIGDLFK